MSNLSNQFQISQESILDLNGKQAYLGNAFSAGINGTSIASTSETALITISNPAAITSGQKALFVDFALLSGMTASSTVIFRIYYNPTISAAGSVVTPTNIRTGSSNTPVAVVHSLPTASSNGTFLSVLAVSPTTTGSSTILRVVDPGSTLLITAQCSVNPTLIGAEIGWYEL
jgi:hypothetical protein